MSGKPRHGHSWRGGWTPTYGSWVNTLARCRNPNKPEAHNYVNRGIYVDPRFLADMGERPPGKTLDRDDNDLGYFKANCQWATRKQQSRNRRVVKLDADKAAAIRSDPRSYRTIAADYDIPSSHVSNIKNGRKWAPDLSM